MGTNLKLKKQRWFADGAASFASIRRDPQTVPMYPCPICLRPFPREALDDERLSAEDVPPKSVGGAPLLLTCTSCNNDSGKSIDADAKDREELRDALAGKTIRRGVAIVGGQSVRGDFDFAEGRFMPLAEINPPGTRDHLRTAAPIGTNITVDLQERSELGKNISWLKAGYLVLVAEYGFDIAFDPAMAIVREQILNYDSRRMVTFLREGSGDIGVSVRHIYSVLTPEDHNGWAVQIGRFWLDYPSKGDLTFYDRLARYAGVYTHTTLRVMRIPTKARFGFS